MTHDKFMIVKLQFIIVCMTDLQMCGLKTETRGTRANYKQKWDVYGQTRFSSTLYELIVKTLYKLLYLCYVENV